MKFSKAFFITLLVLVFIPFTGSTQFLSYALFLATIIIFKKYFNWKIITIFFVAHTFYFLLLKLANLNEVYIKNFIFGAISTFPLIIFFVNQRGMEIQHSKEKFIKSLNIVFVVYSFVLIIQKLLNIHHPDAAIGFHGVSKGHHLNSQLYFLLSGFFFFEKRYRWAAYYFFIALLGSFALALLIFLSTMVGVFLYSIRKHFTMTNVLVYAIGIGLAIFSIVKLNIVGIDANKLLGTVDEISTDNTRSRKLVFLEDYFTKFYSADNSVAYMITGTGLGNGLSRSSLYLTDFYFRGTNIPENFQAYPRIMKEFMLPYIAHVGKFNSQGTINQPYSNLLAILSELGIIGSIILFYLLYKRFRKLMWMSSESNSLLFLLAYFFMFFVLNHEYENIPVMALMLLLFMNLNLPDKRHVLQEQSFNAE